MTAKSAAADGYTMLLNGNGTAISATLFKSLPYWSESPKARGTGA
jgi:hypothetical protein